MRLSRAFKRVLGVEDVRLDDERDVEAAGRLGALIWDREDDALSDG